MLIAVMRMRVNRVYFSLFNVSATSDAQMDRVQTKITVKIEREREKLCPCNVEIFSNKCRPPEHQFSPRTKKFRMMVGQLVSSQQKLNIGNKINVHKHTSALLKNGEQLFTHLCMRWWRRRCSICTNKQSHAGCNVKYQKSD